MKLFSKITLFFLALAILAFFCLKKNPSASSQKPLVVITKIVSHPSLDKIEQGILDAFEAENIPVNIVRENAHGNMVTAVQIGQKAAAINPSIIIPITTPSTQAVYKEALSRNIPVVFAGVSDPVQENLVDPITLKGKGITGVSDFPPLKEQLDMIQSLQPNLKILGVLYNPSETNSVTLIKELENLSTKRGITLIKASCPNMQTASDSTLFLLEKVEALYVPNDNTVISALDMVIATVKEKIPVYASDPDSVERGCLGAVAYGQYEIGLLTGKRAIEVLKGASIDELPVLKPAKFHRVINQPLAKKEGISSEYK